MAEADDNIPEIPLVVEPPEVAIADGEIVVSSGTSMIVMSREAALQLARRLTEVAQTI